MTTAAHEDYAYWVKPVPGEEKKCSGYAKVNLFTIYAPMLENRYRDLGYIQQTPKEAADWTYVSRANGEMPVVVD